jgi:DNA-binding transcriptional MerR regulator
VRVKELAELTGTTVRTVRYYHELGLLAVPEVCGSYRDYDLTHVARLTRIRWLAQAGVRLSTIAELLAAQPGDEDGRLGADRSVLADLRATVVEVEEQLERLHEQRDRLWRLIAAVEAGGPVSPMPASMVRFYDEMERRAENADVRREVRREREFNELAFYRGEMPPEAELLFHGLQEADLRESLSSYRRIAEQAAAPDRLSEEETRAIAAANAQRIARQLGSELPRLARTVDVEVARRAVDLFVRTGRNSERRLNRALGEAILALIADAGST